MALSVSARAPLLAGLLACVACDTSLGSGADATPISAACQEAAAHSDLAWIQENVFEPSCAFASSCHGGATPAAELNLEAGQSETELVDQMTVSAGIEGETLVVPGDDGASYLMVIIDHESRGGRLAGPLPAGGTMPLNNPLLCVEKRDAVARWIRSL